MTTTDDGNLMTTTQSDGADSFVAGEPAAASVTIVRLVNLLLRRRRLVVGSGLFVFLVAVMVTLVTARSYTASASFLPQSQAQSPSSLTAIAAQLGFSAPAAQPTQLPAFYSDLLTSRELLYDAVETQYAFTGMNGLLWFADSTALEGDLVELFGMSGKNLARQTEKATRQLRRRIAVHLERETGVVTFSVTTQWPSLSQQIVVRLLDLVSEFNLLTRQSQAAAERRFIEERLAAVTQDVRQAEDRLATFLQRNRDFRNSPDLSFEHDRLQRDLNLRQDVLKSLTEAHEQARIEEVRDTPVVTLVEPPRLPGIPDRRRLILKGLVGLLAGMLIGAGAASWGALLERGRLVEPDAFEEFSALKREAAAGVRRFLPLHRPKDD